MEAFAKTDIGKAREMNQDYYAVPDWEDPMHLYILADGMGGYNGGEVASKLATLVALHYIKSNFDTIVKDKDSILVLIKSVMEYANMVVYEKAASDPELTGMGTTLEICLIYNNKIYIGHVGDVAEIIRLAVTNRQNSPNLHEVLVILGKDEVDRRIERAIKSLN